MISVRVSRLTTAVVASAIVGAFVACGSNDQGASSPSNATATSSAPASSSATTSSTSASATTSASVAWKDMNHDQKIVYMKNTFMPAMKPDFVAFNSKYESNFTCGTCHGKDGKERGFQMPSNDLPKFSFDGVKKIFETKKDVAEWMMKVEHHGAELLGTQPFDPKTKQGFSCFGCHALAK